MTTDKEMPALNDKEMPYSGPVTDADIAWFRKFIRQMCSGDRSSAWRMCIPVQPDDSDMICVRILKKLQAETTPPLPDADAAKALECVSKLTGIPALYGFTEPVEGYAERPQDLERVMHEMGKATLHQPDTVTLPREVMATAWEHLAQCIDNLDSAGGWITDDYKATLKALAPYVGKK